MRQHALPSQPLERRPRRPGSASIGTFAQLNTAWNIRNSTTASSSGPATGCSTTRIEPREHRQRAPARGSRSPRASRRTSRCVASISAAARGEPAPARSRDARRARSRDASMASTSCALAAGAHRHRLHHRHAECALERGAIEPVAALLGDVAHVERDDHRPPEALQLQHQTQVQAQVGGIDDAHQQIGRRLARVAAEDHVARDGLIEAWRARGCRRPADRDAVGAPAARAGEASFLALDGDAGIVGDFLAAAGEAVEERGLAAVRNADERETAAAARRAPRPPRRSWGLVRVAACASSTQIALRLAPAQSERRVADAHDEGITAGPGLGQ